MTANQVSDFINRLVVLVAGMLIAFCLLWAGSEMHDWVISTQQIPKGCPDETLDCSINPWPTILICSLCAITSVGGGIILIRAILKIKAGGHFSDIGSIFETVVGVTCFLFTFGAIVAPLQNKGTWLSPLDFLLVLVVSHVAIVVKDVAFSLFDTEAAAETPQRGTGERTPLKKVA